ncbi:ATP synthase subunit J [Apiospora phragmitis]|uniref:ATP synthase subunit J n=1 Tax=Apiospora phragmitis TaxID=2905665 RepID=A0ABR1USZ6_9PEZI
MAWFGITPLKKFPTPVLKPLAPFFAAGTIMRSATRITPTRPIGRAIILYGVNSAQNAMMRSDEWKNDPRNPNAKSGGH